MKTCVIIQASAKSTKPLNTTTAKSGAKQSFHMHHDCATDEYSWHEAEHYYADDPMSDYCDTGSHCAEAAISFTDGIGVARATTTADDYVDCVIRETGCQVGVSDS